MARKVTETYPVITLTIGGEVPKYHRHQMQRPEALAAEREIIDLIKTVLLRTTQRQMDIGSKLVEEATCEHCGWAWTEASPEYNGGCCGKDEANSPARLADLATLIDAVEGGDFYRWDADHGRDRVAVDWPWAMASAADLWVKAGRPAEGVSALLPLIKRVKSTDWCGLWEDPGPSGASLARLPDRVTQDIRPDQLADELLSLIDDMGLTPERAAAYERTAS